MTARHLSVPVGMAGNKMSANTAYAGKIRRITMKISIIYTSQGGNTEFAAECVQDGILAKYPFIEVKTMDAGEGETDLDFLTQSDAVIFGSPVYFTSMSWKLKRWFDQSFKIDLTDKIGAAFVTAQSPTGGTDTAIMEIVRHMLAKGMLVCSGAGKGQAFQIGAVGLANMLNQSENLFRSFGAAIAQKAVERNTREGVK